jgi:outer membrane receptor for ferrienterochelin and colicins
MRIFLILLIVLFSTLLQAQKAIIKVIDGNTLKPLPYVNICFESFETDKKQYTTTNYEGETFNICNDSCIIAISYVGYKTVEDTITKNENKLIYMEEDVFNLDQIVVTATRSKKALKDAPVITQVITSKDISNRGINNVKDILEQDIPGVEFQRGGFGADIKMQGLEAKNILILIDGERLAGETGYNIDYNRLNADNVERIEVVKGAASALYGSQAMGGVINIITKKSVQKWEASISGQWTQRNEVNFPDLDKDDAKYEAKKNLDLQNLNCNASIGFNLKHISGRMDFNAKSFDGYLLYNKKGVIKDFINIDTIIYDTLNPFPTGINGYKDYSINQKLEFPVSDKLTIKLKGSYYNHNEYDFVPDNVYQNYVDYSFGGKIDYLISEKSNVTATINYDNYKKYDFFERLNDKSLNYRNLIINPKVTGFIIAGKHQQITGGVEYLSESLLTNLFGSNSNENKKSITSVLFIQDDISLGKHWNFISGARIDYHTVFGAHVSPKISGMYKIKSWTFRVNYANGFRSPSLKELYLDWSVAWFTIKGNENLKPETNNYFSGSIEFTKSFINTSVTAYYNNIKNKIDGIWKENQTVYQYVNVNSAKLSGVDILTSIKLLNHFLISGAYSYLKDKRPQGELVSSASPHTGNIKINWNYVWKEYELNINISSTITGAKNFLESDNIVYRGEIVEGIYPVHYESYSIWRLSINQSFLQGINLTVGIDNIFNYTADIVSFNTSTTPGRRGYISLNINIDKLIKTKSINKKLKQ